jgi:hypothetical protein
VGLARFPSAARASSTVAHEQATEGTPYTVVPTNLGFNVELDLGERQWRDVFGRAGLRRMYRWEG